MKNWFKQISYNLSYAMVTEKLEEIMSSYTSLKQNFFSHIRDAIDANNKS